MNQQCSAAVNSTRCPGVGNSGNPSHTALLGSQSLGTVLREEAQSREELETAQRHREQHMQGPSEVLESM